MIRSKIAGIAHYVPDNVVTNDDLARHMETSDEWIQERTGIKERRYGTKHKESTASMGAEAARRAIADAGITAEEVDFIIFATLSHQYRNWCIGYTQPMLWLCLWSIHCRSVCQNGHV